MIQGVSSGGHVGVVALTALRYAQTDGYAVIMPVRPAQAIVANFKHIQLRPDSRLEDGIPLYKLKILDSLIDQMAKTGAASPPGESGPGNSARIGITAKNIDGVITGLTGAGRAESGAYRPGFFFAPGAFVDLVA